MNKLTKTLALTLLSASIFSGTVITAQAKDLSAEMGSYMILSGLAVSYVVAAPFMLLDKISDNSSNSSKMSEQRNLKVTKVTYKDNQKTEIQAVATYDSQAEPFTFEVDTKKAIETNVAIGQYLDVKRVNSDYLLNSNSKPLILIQGKNSQYFKSQKIN